MIITTRIKKHVMMLALILLSTTAVYAQKTVTFNLQSVPVKTLFDQIQRQTGYSFVYSTEDLKSLPPVSVNAKNESVNSVLARVLKDTGLAFNINKRIITVKHLSDDRPKVARTIHGQVLDDKGEPLPGAAVFPTGFLEHGTSTDENGKYVLRNVPAEAKSISAIMLGMKTEVVMIGRKENVNLIMHEEVNSLDNVVVTGYQKIDKRYSTSAVTSIKMEDLNVPGFASIDQMMEGKIPDLVMTTNSGEINATPRLRIRGTSTLIGNRSPLWVLDGIVLTDPIDLSPDVLNDPDYVNRVGNAISGINPQDILRIDVLKDAAATALYGTRAANGVIVITTKSGREGKAIVSYSNTFTARRRPYYTDSKINLMNSNERVQFSQYLVDQHYQYPSGMPLVGYEYALKNLYEGTYTQEQFDSEVSAMAARNTDWFDILCHNSLSQDHNASVSGGSDNIRYYASVGYTGQDDVIKNTTNNRYTGMIKLNINITKKFDIEFNINAYQNDRMYNASEINPTDYAYNTARTIPAYNADGTYSYYKKLSGNNDYLNYNILNDLDNSFQSQEVSNVMGTVNLLYHPLNWLHLSGIISVNSSSSTSEQYYGESTYHSSALRRSDYGENPGTNSVMPYGGEYTLSTTRTKGYTARFQADANKFFGAEMQHLFNLSIGSEASSSQYQGYKRTDRCYFMDRGKLFVSDIPDEYSEYKKWLYGNVPTITDTKTNLISAYATLSYTFKELFTLNANTRYDGSNKFGSRSNEKILPIWSVSGNANILEITKLEKDWIDFLTFKASYGEQGNMLDDQTPVMVIKKGSLDTYYNEMVSTAAYFANPDLKWEKTHSFNMGLESSFLSGRLQVGLEFYHKRTTDAFLSKKISDVNGYNSYVVNSGTIINKGFNFNISATPIKMKDFYWITSGNLSKIYNKVETTPGGETYELDDFLNGTAIVEGQSVGTFYSYKFIGLSSVDGGPIFEDWEERQSELENLSKYEAYTRVLVPSGKREADLTGSLFNTFTYKQWRLGVNLTYAFGASTRLFRLFDNMGNYSSEVNMNRDLLNRWQKPGDEAYTDIPSILGKGNKAYYQYDGHWSDSYYYTGPKFGSNAWDMYDHSTARVVSADYVKLQNISLTYEFNKKLIKSWGLGRLALTLSGANLHTWCDSRLKGQTPTQGGFTEIQLSDCPTYTFGLNIEF